MSKAFNFLTVQSEHTVYPIKFLAEIFYIHWQKIIDYKMGIDFKGHSVLGTY